MRCASLHVSISFHILKSPPRHKLRQRQQSQSGVPYSIKSDTKSFHLITLKSHLRPSPVKEISFSGRNSTEKVLHFKSFFISFMLYDENTFSLNIIAYRRGETFSKLHLGKHFFKPQENVYENISEDLYFNFHSRSKELRKSC